MDVGVPESTGDDAREDWERRIYQRLTDIGNRRGLCARSSDVTATKQLLQHPTDSYTVKLLDAVSAPSASGLE
jgi:hypothetical protein